MQQIYTCTFEPHKNEPIIGLCLNPSCQETPQFCSKCMLEKHQNHINGCKRFRDLSVQIQQLINENVRPAKVFFEIMKIMTDQFKKTTQMIQNKLHRDFQIQQILTDQQHSVLKENIDYQRTICSVELQDQKKFVTSLCQELENFQNQCEELKFILININDGQEKIYYKKGCQLLKQNQFEKALLQFDLELQKNQNYSDALSHKGACLRNLKRYEEANKCLDLGLQINQNHYHLNLEKDNVLTSQNLHDQAIIFIELAIEIDQNNSLFFFNNLIYNIIIKFNFFCQLILKLFLYRLKFLTTKYYIDDHHIIYFRGLINKKLKLFIIKFKLAVIRPQTYKFFLMFIPKE